MNNARERNAKLKENGKGKVGMKGENVCGIRKYC
jgi:hypothetical protein